jgi:hypothetical protein
VFKSEERKKILPCSLVPKEASCDLLGVLWDFIYNQQPGHKMYNFSVERSGLGPNDMKRDFYIHDLDEE